MHVFPLQDLRSEGWRLLYLGKELRQYQTFSRLCHVSSDRGRGVWLPEVESLTPVPPLTASLAHPARPPLPSLAHPQTMKLGENPILFHSHRQPHGFHGVGKPQSFGLCPLGPPHHHPPAPLLMSKATGDSITWNTGAGLSRSSSLHLSGPASTFKLHLCLDSLRALNSIL